MRPRRNRRTCSVHPDLAAAALLARRARLSWLSIQSRSPWWQVGFGRLRIARVFSPSICVISRRAQSHANPSSAHPQRRMPACSALVDQRGRPSCCRHRILW